MLTPVFATVFAAALLAMMTYNAFETLMPVSLTTEHGYPAASWGILFVVNPVLVMLFQLRVTRWTSSVPAGVKLAIGLTLMGCAFVPLMTTALAPVSSWSSSYSSPGRCSGRRQRTPSRRSSRRPRRGAVMGTMGIAMWVGGALAPAAGLRVADTAGDAAMWGLVALAGVAAAALYWTGVRLLGRERAPEALAEAA